MLLYIIRIIFPLHIHPIYTRKILYLPITYYYHSLIFIFISPFISFAYFSFFLPDRQTTIFSISPTHTNIIICQLSSYQPIYPASKQPHTHIRIHVHVHRQTNTQRQWEITHHTIQHTSPQNNNDAKIRRFKTLSQTNIYKLSLNTKK